MYQVKLQQFEGPFELLLNLIDKKKLSINEISLAKITDQYLTHLKQIQKFPTKEVTAFLITASTLMLIKSRSLIPSLKLSEAEESEISDLEERLKTYQQFREASKNIKKTFGEKIIFNREPFLNIRPTFTPVKDLSISKIKTVLETLFYNLPEYLTAEKAILPQAIIKKTINLEEKINELIKKLENKINLCFSDINKDPECKKVDLIISFLALLELIKQGMIKVKQNYVFGEITINKSH